MAMPSLWSAFPSWAAPSTRSRTGAVSSFLALFSALSGLPWPQLVPSFPLPLLPLLLWLRASALQAKMVTSALVPRWLLTAICALGLAHVNPSLPQPWTNSTPPTSTSSTVLKKQVLVTTPLVTLRCTTKMMLANLHSRPSMTAGPLALSTARTVMEQNSSTPLSPLGWTVSLKLWAPWSPSLAALASANLISSGTRDLWLTPLLHSVALITWPISLLTGSWFPAFVS